ncbi:hypothetical protein BDF19DRAFT_292213 [Syncephalis fuscata]|nr:hypothetical protein BDF19DRAFT_292213 [Syncephalis fuscata]
MGCFEGLSLTCCQYHNIIGTIKIASSAQLWTYPYKNWRGLRNSCSYAIVWYYSIISHCLQTGWVERSLDVLYSATIVLYLHLSHIVNSVCRLFLLHSSIIWKFSAIRNNSLRYFNDCYILYTALFTVLCVHVWLSALI